MRPVEHPALLVALVEQHLVQLAVHQNYQDFAWLVVQLAELVVRPVVHPVLLVELLEQLVELVVPHLVIAVKLAVHLVRLVVHLVLAGQILPQPRKFGRRSSVQLLQFGLYLFADCWMSVPLAVRLG